MTLDGVIAELEEWLGFQEAYNISEEQASVLEEALEYLHQLRGLQD